MNKNKMHLTVHRICFRIKLHIWELSGLFSQLIPFMKIKNWRIRKESYWKYISDTASLVRVKGEVIEM